MKRQFRTPLIILIGGLIATVGSLSIHAIILQGLHIPFPAHIDAWSPSRIPDRILRGAGVVALFTLFPRSLKESPLRAKAWLTFLLLTVNENLIRDPLMEVVNLSNFTLYPFVDAVPQYFTALFVASCVVISRAFLNSWRGRVAIAVLVGLFGYMVVAPIAVHLWIPIQFLTATREGYELYHLPYGWQILVPAYLTFIEAVIGAFLIAASVSDRLPNSRKWALISLAALIFALRGTLFSCFTTIPISGFSPTVTILSVGQFSLESLFLAIVVALTWMIAMRPRWRSSQADLPGRS